jgi:hypothetical protein
MRRFVVSISSWARRTVEKLHWYDLVPEAILVAGLTFFLVDETSAATSAFSSSRAITLMVVGAALWLIARVVFTWFVRWPAVRLVVFGAAAVGVLAIVVLPAYDNTTVVEPFPGAAAAPTNPSTAPPGTAPGTAPDAAPDPPTTTAPPQPVVIGTAMLVGIDHRAAGTVNVYEQPDGSHVVGLEGIDVQPGPDYDVYVVRGSDRRDLGDAIRLDDLRGNQGTQFYDVASGADLAAGPWTLLIWCETFAVPIANATPV